MLSTEYRILGECLPFNCNTQVAHTERQKNKKQKRNVVTWGSDFWRYEAIEMFMRASIRTREIVLFVMAHLMSFNAIV